jgi:hypothetical protein
MTRLDNCIDTLFFSLSFIDNIFSFLHLINKRGSSFFYFVASIRIMASSRFPQLKVFRTIWGAETQFSPDIELLFSDLHRLGFDGIEASLNDIHRLSKNNDEVFMRTLSKNKLELIASCYTNWADFEPGTWQDLTVDEHLNNLKRELEQVMKYNPVRINIHGGQDNWTLEQQETFFEGALALQAKYPNVSSSHEVCSYYCFY